MMNTLLILFSVLSLPLFAAVQMENAQTIRTALGLNQYAHRANLNTVKIAIIDNGFSGFEPDGKYLPLSATLVSQYNPEFIKKYSLGDPNYHLAAAQTEHGRIMAQVIWGITGAHAEGPRFYLLNANGITNFRRAVRYAIEEKVDIILYAQNRECCGNYDGGGFLNAIVNEATSQGILWINAAGNYGGNVYNGYLNQKQEFRLKSHLDENPAQVILTWNSSGPQENSGTEKDLDLFIYDENSREVAKSELKQVLEKPTLGEGETFLPRERIRFTFNKNRRGNFRIVVRAKSSNFTNQDQIRLVVIPEKPPTFNPEKNGMVDSVELLDATRSGEIMVPADNPNVITVGDLGRYSSQGPTADGRTKPEIILEGSAVSFSDGQSSEGTSNAAAVFAGVVAVLKSYRVDLNRNTILSFPKQLASAPQPVSLNEFVSLHREILRFIDGIAEESPVLIGRYSDGRYALGMQKNPQDFLSQYCNVYSEEVEFYLLLNSSTNQIQCFTRAKSSGKNTPYPWDQNNYSGRTKQDYVEVRQVYSKGRVNPSNLSQGLWRTPLPQELFFYR